MLLNYKNLENINDFQFLQNKEIALKEYVKGIQWILDYYTGDNVDIDWYYPYMSVPLYKDLYKYF